MEGGSGDNGRPMKRILLATALPAVLLAAHAHAFRQPDYLAERPIEVAAGVPTHVGRLVAHKTPVVAAQAFDAFRAKHGAWKALWDAETQVPARLWGEGIAAPGAMHDPAAAERVARAVLAEQLALLAPGASVDDFVVVQNVNRAGVRSVWMEQRWQGLRVVGAGIRFAFKHDRLVAIGSLAAPHVAAAIPTQRIARATADQRAQTWIEDLYGVAPSVLDRGEAVVLRVGGTYRVVVPVTVDLASPRAQWTVYVDAKDGAPVARRQRLAFAEGTVNYRVPRRHPGGGYAEFPAAFATHSVDGVQATANVAGLVTWAAATAGTVSPGLFGTYATVTNAGGPIATTSLTVQPGGAATWDLSADELGDAQLNAYIHATIAKRYAIDTLDPDLPWLHQQIPVFVNEGDNCNAYSQLDDIHFFVEGQGCGNTARLADVVYHEFGHSLHGQSRVGGLDNFDGALSEGVSDYYAGTITGDPAMGLGFFLSTPNEGLRHLDPPDREYRWPEDNNGFPHDTGRIIGGALWDLRKALIVELGQEAGVALADDIFYGIISRADGIPESYVEALITDDDDGNLDNGTPHKCVIDRAFGAHGLGESGTVFGRVAPPTVTGQTLTLVQPDVSGACPPPQIASANISWRLRDDVSTGGTIDFTVSGSELTATLPDVPEGSVIEYQVAALMDDDTRQFLPQNAADPWYQLYVGPVTPIVCAGFESDPGWQLSGFSIGTPSASTGSDDPSAAYAGSGVLGIAIGGTGVYSPDTTYRAVMPEVDVTAYPNVRLQLRRWLNVEDGVYDPATITVDGAMLWSNAASQDGTTHHQDREWRFQDLDLTPVAQDGKVEVSFTLTSDQAVEFGGWNLDEVCLVTPGDSCGNGWVGEAEECDDGNLADGDDCSSTCTLPDSGEGGGCCSTQRDGAAGPILLALGVFGLVIRRRVRLQR